MSDYVPAPEIKVIDTYGLCQLITERVLDPEENPRRAALQAELARLLPAIVSVAQYHGFDVYNYVVPGSRAARAIERMTAAWLCPVGELRVGDLVLHRTRFAALNDLPSPEWVDRVRLIDDTGRAWLSRRHDGDWELHAADRSYSQPVTHVLRLPADYATRREEYVSPEFWLGTSPDAETKAEAPPTGPVVHPEAAAARVDLPCG